MTIRSQNSMTPFEHLQWKSHQPLLELVIKQSNIETVIELGAGYFSTHFLADLVDKLISVEEQEPWRNEILKTAPKNVEMPTIEETDNAPLEWFIQSDIKPELVFIDCASPREKCLQEAINKNIPYIVIHDYEGGHNWRSVKTNGYLTFVLQPKGLPWTALYTKDKDLINIAYMSLPEMHRKCMI